MTGRFYVAIVLSLAGAGCGVDGGLSNADTEAIGQEAVARLSQRRHNTFHGLRRGDPCTDNFALGQPKIADATLGPTTGKVSVVVPITAIKFQDNGPNSIPQYSVPDVLCWGIQPRVWSEQPVEIAFQYDVEKWQSGWRISQQQGQRLIQ
jgi:hypothetical protein